ncbi:hypothetical protein KJ682_02485 [bacterium]|nr:hypothetical protein [bacterium]
MPRPRLLPLLSGSLGLWLAACACHAWAGDATPPAGTAGPGVPERGPRLAVAAVLNAPREDLLADLDPAAGWVAGLEVRLGTAAYVRLEGLWQDSPFAPESLVRVEEDATRYNEDYLYRDVCLMLGLDLLRPRIGRPHPFVELGAGVAGERFAWVSVDPQGRNAVDRETDRVYFVAAGGAGIGFPLHRRLDLELGVSVRIHWDTDPGTGLFDDLTGELIPVADQDPTTTSFGTFVGVRLGLAWALG